jgi:hypothetical protein
MENPKSQKLKPNEMLSAEQLIYVNSNYFRIEHFIDSDQCRVIIHKYKTTVGQHRSELISELYLTLRKTAYYCNNENAYAYYIQKAFERTVEEYFIAEIRRQRGELKAIEKRGIYRPEPKPFALLNCSKIRMILRKAALSRQQRKSFIFRNGGLKLTFKQISKKLRCSEANAKKHYYKAKIKIKEYVKMASIDIADIYRTPTRAEYAKLL